MIAAKNGISIKRVLQFKSLHLRKMWLQNYVTGKQHVVDILLERGADSNIKDDNGKKAIDFAFENGEEYYLCTLKV